MTNVFHAPMNSAGAVPEHEGYRLENRYPDPLDPPDPRAPRDPFVALSFSGGGTRAAALSYGALEVLRDSAIPAHGEKTRVLDCVEVISSVSGGSFTAAYHGLFGDRIFDPGPEGYRRQMLYADLQSSLIGSVLSPWNEVRLLSPYFDRVDLAAEVYARYFGDKTYADLAPSAALTTPGRRALPFVVLNATNMALGARFEFTQHQFDLIGSVLDDYRIARAVAASSAFPVAFSPLTLANHGAPPSFSWQPYEDGANNVDSNIDSFRESVVALEYRSRDAHPNVHLLDGGLADNTGARFLLSSLRRDDGTLQQLLLNGSIDTLAIIMVNAKGAPSSEIDRHRNAPGVVRVLIATGTVAMDNYVDESVMAVEGALKDLARACKKLYELQAHTPWQDPDPRPDRDQQAIRFPVVVSHNGRSWVRTVSVYVVHVTFDALRERRREMLAVDTNFSLGEQTANDVIASAATLLRDNREYQTFLADLRDRPGAAISLDVTEA